MVGTDIPASVTHSSASSSKERFSSRVDAYVAARPRYPREVLGYLQNTIGLAPAWHVVDVGSGTGISCELFLESGNGVTGVEPNAPMRAAAEKSLAPFGDKFRSINGSAEATTLPPACADLALAAQAFHWFDIPAAAKEFARILKPAGHALLMWNTRKLGGTPFLDAYEKLLVAYGTDYLKSRHNNIEDADLRAFFSPGGYRAATFPNHQHLDFAGLRLRLLSSSYIPTEPDPRFAPMMNELQTIFTRHNAAGRVTIEYETEVFLGKC
jgi:SAM-dependent methyltransferase